MIAVIIAIAVIVVALLAGAAAAIKIVREYQRVVLFRLGRSSGARGPGLVVINPITDRVTLVDLREQFLEIPHQVAITKDNASIAIDFIIFTKVFDPVMSVLAVRDFRGAALNVAATTLRAVVGDMSLDEVLSKREDMNNTLRFKLDDVTERWGVKVTNVEVREINPPPGRAGRHDPSDVRRADPAGGGHRGGRHQAGRHHRGRGPEAVGHPGRRGRPAGRHRAGRRVRAGAPADLRSRPRGSTPTP